MDETMQQHYLMAATYLDATGRHAEANALRRAAGAMPDDPIADIRARAEAAERVGNFAAASAAKAEQLKLMQIAQKRRYRSR